MSFREAAVNRDIAEGVSGHKSLAGGQPGGGGNLHGRMCKIGPLGEGRVTVFAKEPRDMKREKRAP